MKLTYYGHSCFGLEIKGKHLLFDPFISPIQEQTGLNVDEIPADYILVTHGHEDHVADVERVAKRTGAQLISNFEIIQYFEKKGIEGGHGMNFGGQWSFDFGKVKYVPALHSSNMPDGSYGGNPGGFVVYTDDKVLYYAGDTALSMEMKLLEDEGIDLVLLPIGDNYTMGYQDAVKASTFVNCNRVVGMHYDTFDPIKLDHDAAKNAFQTANKELILMQIGETLKV